MKKNLFKSLILVLCIPIFLISFCGCGKKPLDIKTYFTEVKSTLTNGSGTMADISLDDLTASSPNLDVVNTYFDFTLTANPDWIYKMFIESISFKIYIHNKLENIHEIVFTMRITNAVTEENVGKQSSDLTDEEKEHSFHCSIVPSEKGSFDVKFDVNLVLGYIDAKTGSNIIIDISEYDEQGATSNPNSGSNTPIQWTIYGLEIYGESRTYN